MTAKMITGKGYRREKRRTRRRSYRREEISRIVEGVLKTRRQDFGQDGAHSQEVCSASIDEAEPTSVSVGLEPVRIEPLHPSLERILDFAKLLEFVRQEAALILDDDYCEDLLALCIDQVSRQYELSREGHYGPGPNKLLH